jgi:alkylated DNA repair dioxygenase AlkB
MPPARPRPMATQADLFQATALPEGLRYEADFLSESEEAALLDAIGTLPLQAARYKRYTARRRIASFGSGYDFDSNALQPAPSIPDFLLPLRARAAHWVDVLPETFAQALVSEYQPGTPLGWHRDVPDFGVVVGISLHGWARMRFRPYPQGSATHGAPFALDLAPRSAYVLRGEARWRWQHAVSATKSLRYSITFRTLASRAPRGSVPASRRSPG